MVARAAGEIDGRDVRATTYTNHNEDVTISYVRWYNVAVETIVSRIVNRHCSLYRTMNRSVA